MTKRAMVVVAAGASERFGGDKVTSLIMGQPLLWHTVNAVIDSVDRCVVVLREDLVAWFEALELGVDVTVGGPTRSSSELAGVRMLEDGYELTGIHDGARPLVSSGLIESLFVTAARVGGAIPLIPVDETLVDPTASTVEDLSRAQTPQVFRSIELTSALRLAERDGYSGPDTADVVQRYTDLVVQGVQGEMTNLKVTYPEDLRQVQSILEDPSRT